MKRLLILSLLVVSAVSASGCRWIGWGRQGDVCNACSGGAGYPTETYYGGETYGGEFYSDQAIQNGMPVMPVPESLPSPMGPR